MPNRYLVRYWSMTHAKISSGVQHRIYILHVLRIVEILKMSQLFSNSVKISYFNDKQRNLKNEKNQLCVLQFIVSATLLNL